MQVSKSNSLLNADNPIMITQSAFCLSFFCLLSLSSTVTLFFTVYSAYLLGQNNKLYFANLFVRFFSLWLCLVCDTICKSICSCMCVCECVYVSCQSCCCCCCCCAVKVSELRESARDTEKRSSSSPSPKAGDGPESAAHGFFNTSRKKTRLPHVVVVAEILRAVVAAAWYSQSRQINHLRSIAYLGSLEFDYVLYCSLSLSLFFFSLCLLSNA